MINGTTMSTKQTADKLTERTMIPISKRMLQEIEDFRFSARIGSKSATIRRLIVAGLQAERERATK